MLTDTNRYKIKIIKMAAALLMAAFVLFALSCAKKPPVTPVGSLLTKAELQASLAAGLVQFDSLKGFARIEYRNNGKKKAADHVVFADYPDRLRLETLGLFGSPAMLAATDGDSAVVLLPGEAVAFAGSADAGFLDRITGIPITPEMIVSILLRRPNILISQDVKASYPGDGISRLTMKNAQLSQTIDFDLQGHIVRVVYLDDERPITMIGYSGYENGFPGQVELDLINADVKVAIKFEDIETNVELNEALFRLVPTNGYKVKPFPEM